MAVLWGPLMSARQFFGDVSLERGADGGGRGRELGAEEWVGTKGRRVESGDESGIGGKGRGKGGALFLRSVPFAWHHTLTFFT